MREVPEERKPRESKSRENDSRERIVNAAEELLAERIDGRIYIMKRPKRWHQRIVRILKEMIEEYQKTNPGLCEVRTAPFGLTLAGGGTTYLIPDICVILDRGIMTKQGCNGAPEIVIEVVAPETQYMDYRIKLTRYRNAGVKEYWIVDRDWDHGYVYYFEDGDMDLASFSGALASRVCRGLVFDFSRIKRRR